MAAISGRSELAEALEVIESTNLRYFSREMTAEFSALKGLLLAQSGNSEEAYKAFSAATQMHDTLIKAWALWGDYLEQIFTKESRQIQVGVGAVICFLHACRHQNESKSRKYLAKVLWLLSYDDERSSLMEAVDRYAVGVPPLHWLPWIQQLLCSLVQYEGTAILNLLSQVIELFLIFLFFMGLDRNCQMYRVFSSGRSNVSTSCLLPNSNTVPDIENRATGKGSNHK